METTEPPNPYNVYDDCGANSAYLRLFNKYYAKATNRLPVNEKPNINCPHQGFTDYLNIPEVRKALHVRPEDTHHWSDCGGSYEGVFTDQRPIIMDLINKYNIGKLVIFNGNFDTVCDHIDNNRFVDSLAFKKDGHYRYD